jgi:hypothetical protein
MLLRNQGQEIQWVANFKRRQPGLLLVLVGVLAFRIDQDEAGESANRTVGPEQVVGSWFKAPGLDVDRSLSNTAAAI